MNSRECHPCTACCEGWLLSDHIEMSPGNPCRHCTAQGCAIYADRPVEPCRNFQCGWLREPTLLPDDMRPDLCGAIILFNRKWNRWNVVKAIPTGEKIPDETMSWLMNYVKETRTPLIFQIHLVKNGRFIGMKMMGAGPPAFIEDVRNAIGPEDIFKI